MKKKLEHWQIINIALVIFDIIGINLAYLFALFLRFDFTYSYIPQLYFQTFIKMIPIYTIVSLIVFNLMKMYQSLWRFAGVTELLRGLIASIITSVFYILFSVFAFVRMPISYYIMGGIIQFLLVTGIRFTYRLFNIITDNLKARPNMERVLIYGAGEAGRLIYNDIKNYKNIKYDVIGFIDDNENKHGRYISSTPILGGREIVVETVEDLDVDSIILALPSASRSHIKDIIDVCKESGAKLKTLPSIEGLLDNKNVNVNNIRDVQIEDLLERKQIKINSQHTLDNIKDKTILVTGGGGSIGSELSRQIARNKPKRLILFDIYENNLYAIEQELRRNYPELDLVALIGSVRDPKKLDDVFFEYRPQIVYHAAAHKHVPLMETSPIEAIKNNVFGTYNTAFAALRYKVEKFILISTDKAVNPTNIMGATKRMCEMIIQAMDYVSKTKDDSILPKFESEKYHILRPYDKDFTSNFVAVRFGNVLGSNGSVIPLFKKQIAEGGPVTVTHKDIIRYFMTIPEAVGLVIEAGFNAKGGEIFVLDMGEPVKIDTLARNLIKLSGLKPDVDIDIVYTGLRPGEKLYEEKLMAEEGLQKTDNQIIHIAKPIDIDFEKFFKNMSILRDLVEDNVYKESLDILAKVVVTYHSPDSDLELNKEKFEELYKDSK